MHGLQNTNKTMSIHVVFVCMCVYVCMCVCVCVHTSPVAIVATYFTSEFKVETMKFVEPIRDRFAIPSTENQ